jgi:uncharacterized membrane protein
LEKVLLGNIRNRFQDFTKRKAEPTLLDLGIAVAAGGISGYAKVEPKVSGSVAGTAIVVALMPLIYAIGLGLA